MRLYFTSNLTLSEDDSTTPNNIIYQDSNRSVTDTTTILEAASGSQSFLPSATDVALPMGQIAQGKWLYLYSSGDFSIKIDGAAAGITLAGSKPHQLWVDFTSLSISNPSAVSSITLSYALGGDPV
jgi:hypothetical protein